MEENILEVNFLGFFPDMVVVRRLDGEGTDTRRYVPQDLYESVDGANRAWREENRKLRELVRQMAYAISPTSREHMLANLAELGVEVDA